jgi:hypothetical protein
MSITLPLSLRPCRPGEVGGPLGGFGNAERAEEDDRAEESQSGVGFRRAIGHRQLKPGLQTAKINRRTIQGLRHFPQSWHGEDPFLLMLMSIAG